MRALSPEKAFAPIGLTPGKTFRLSLYLFSLLLPLSTMAQQPVLPPTKPNPGEPEKLSTALKVSVREYRFVGNTVFTSRELAKVLAPYTNREVNTDELEDARRALTLLYVNKGYINSGAVLDDQSVQGGIITFRIVEGRLTEIRVLGNKRLRANFIKKRIEQGAGPPLNIEKLKEKLLLVKENPNLKRLNAELKPGVERGESSLEVQVAEQNPFHLGLEVRNDRPPSVGAEALEILAADQNLTGNGDTLDFQYGVAQRTRDSVKFSGVENLAAFYTLPINAYDTSLQFHYSRNDFSVIEEPFESLDILSRSSTYAVALRQPVYKTAGREFSATLSAERRHSESFLLGQPFSFSAGAVNGKSDVSVLRFINEYVGRSQIQVLALRSTFSWGLDVLGATKNGTDRDAEFIAWLGQAQYVRRLWNTPNQCILSANFQWSSDPLLSLEQFSIGGSHTVRGYRENQLVRDMGVVTTVEFRVPILFTKAGASLLQLAPFFDFGSGWNVDNPTPSPRELASVGIGLLFDPTAKIHAQLYWGHGFRNLSKPNDRDAQDLGLHFLVRVMAF